MNCDSPLWERCKAAEQRVRELELALSENSAQLDLAKLHKALEPFAMAALTSRDEWHKQDGAMAELGVPDDADAWMPDGITQGQLNAVEAFYEQIEKVLNAANR